MRRGGGMRPTVISRGTANAVCSAILAMWIHDRRDREPDVPLLYLQAQGSSFTNPEGEALIRGWIESWSPGELLPASATHWMDEADTLLVADAVREVIDLS